MRCNEVFEKFSFHILRCVVSDEKKWMIHIGVLYQLRNKQVVPFGICQLFW
jgi:hypothetical protein